MPEHRKSRNLVVSRYTEKLWYLGGLGLTQLFSELVRRSRDHNIGDRAAVLSFLFLIALFPLLIAISALIGFLLTEQRGAYVGLLNYLERVMPSSGLHLAGDVLSSVANGASGGKFYFGSALSLSTASAGVKALIEALNVAFEVPAGRRWWHRRLVAIALTLGIGFLLVAGVGLLFAGTMIVRVMIERLPFLGIVGELSGLVRWVTGLILLFLSLTLIYGFGSNVPPRRWEGVVPGAVFALTCWLVTSALLSCLSCCERHTQRFLRVACGGGSASLLALSHRYSDLAGW